MQGNVSSSTAHDTQLLINRLSTSVRFLFACELAQTPGPNLDPALGCGPALSSRARTDHLSG